MGYHSSFKEGSVIGVLKGRFNNLMQRNGFDFEKKKKKTYLDNEEPIDRKGLCDVSRDSALFLIVFYLIGFCVYFKHQGESVVEGFATFQENKRVM